MNLVWFYNFEIDTKQLIASVPSIDIGTLKQQKEGNCEISFFTKRNKDYVNVKEHYLFSGTYEIRCLDVNCCSISLKNEKFYFEMDYNGDLPFGKSRKCP